MYFFQLSLVILCVRHYFGSTSSSSSILDRESFITVTLAKRIFDSACDKIRNGYRLEALQEFEESFSIRPTSLTAHQIIECYYGLSLSPLPWLKKVCLL